MTDRTRILYVCSVCDEEGNNEWCGHTERSRLRVLPDNRWICDGCYDDQPASDLGVDEKTDWKSLPLPPENRPLSAEVVNFPHQQTDSGAK